MSSMINAEQLLQASYRQGEKMLSEPGKVDRLLKKLARKLGEVPTLGGALAYIPKMGMLVNSYIKKQYKEVPLGTIAAVVGVILYFVLPIDLISDFIPAIGYLDDAGVAAASLMLVKGDLDEYMTWRLHADLDTAEPIKN